MTQLQKDIAELGTNFQDHKHSYNISTPGGGARVWITLGYLREYLDDEGNLDSDGFYIFSNEAPKGFVTLETSLPE